MIISRLIKVNAKWPNTAKIIDHSCLCMCCDQAKFISETIDCKREYCKRFCAIPDYWWMLAVHDMLQILNWLCLIFLPCFVGWITCANLHVRSMPSASKAPAFSVKSQSSTLAALSAASLASLSLYCSCPLSFVSCMSFTDSASPRENLATLCAASCCFFLQSKTWT